MPVAAVDGLRPTPERIRETLFNWLAPVIEGARCLDLFAGTGALGFEALSRGARAAELVENAAAAATVLRDIGEQLGAACTVHQMDAFEFLRRSPVRQAFDIVFLDPPFADARYEELCRLLHERGWLAPGALVYIEQDRREDLPELPAGWQAKKHKTAGNVRYSLIETVTERSSR